MFLICKNIFLSSESFLKHPVLVLQMQYSLLPFRKHLRWLFFKFFHLSSVPNSSGFFVCLCWLWLSLLWWEFPATVYLTMCARHSPLSASPVSAMGRAPFRWIREVPNARVCCLFSRRYGFLRDEFSSLSRWICWKGTGAIILLVFDVYLNHNSDNSSYIVITTYQALSTVHILTHLLLTITLRHEFYYALFIDEGTQTQSDRVTFLRRLILCQNKELNPGHLTLETILFQQLLCPSFFWVPVLNQSLTTALCSALGPESRISRGLIPGFLQGRGGKSFGFAGWKDLWTWLFHRQPIQLLVPSLTFIPRGTTFPCCHLLDIWELKPFSASYTVVYQSHTVEPIMCISS